MAHLDDILPALLLGTLEAPARQDAERHLAACARCQEEAARLSPALAGLAALVPPVAPPERVLSSVLDEVEGPGRFTRFADRVAELFDLGREKARALLESLGAAEAWQPGPLPGLSFVPVETGPSRVHGLAVFIRVPPGQRFPDHTHHGREWTLVMEGGLREDSGAETWPGEVLEKDEGSSHAFTALPGPACIAATYIDGVTSFNEPLPG
jgi:putative transcriptional regulator